MIVYVNVALISPTMCGGADPKKLDSSHTLRPPEIRGMLRFWTRALAGGAGLNIRTEERELFGDIHTGQRIKVLPVCSENTTFHLELFPHKTIRYVSAHSSQNMIKSLLNRYNNNANIVSEKLKSNTEMLCHSVKSLLRLRFSIDGLNHQSREKFKAVLWVWLHLGSIGRRSRRGYGSLMWVPLKDDFLSDVFKPCKEQDFATPANLSNYLKNGMTVVEKIWGAPKSGIKRVINADFFMLKTIDQIFVGKVLVDSSGNPANFINKEDGMQAIIHGMDVNSRSASIEKNEMGFVSGHHRLSSPMIWRLYLCQNGFVPVMTWSPKNVDSIDPASNIFNYLQNQLGFVRSLDGKNL